MIIDDTLREGLQSPGISFTVEEKRSWDQGSHSITPISPLFRGRGNEENSGEQVL